MTDEDARAGRGPGRPSLGKVWVSNNRRMEVSTDADIRLIVNAMPETYKSYNKFIEIAIQNLIDKEKHEMESRESLPPR